MADTKSGIFLVAVDMHEFAVDQGRGLIDKQINPAAYIEKRALKAKASACRVYEVPYGTDDEDGIKQALKFVSSDRDIVHTDQASWLEVAYYLIKIEAANNGSRTQIAGNLLDKHLGKVMPIRSVAQLQKAWSEVVTVTPGMERVKKCDTPMDESKEIGSVSNKQWLKEYMGDRAEVAQQKIQRVFSGQASESEINEVEEMLKDIKDSHARLEKAKNKPIDRSIY